MAHTISAVHPVWPRGVHEINYPYVHGLDGPQGDPEQAGASVPSKG
jgi:hypothetical protein